MLFNEHICAIAGFYSLVVWIPQYWHSVRIVMLAFVNLFSDVLMKWSGSKYRLWWSLPSRLLVGSKGSGAGQVIMVSIDVCFGVAKWSVGICHSVGRRHISLNMSSLRILVSFACSPDPDNYEVWKTVYCCYSIWYLVTPDTDLIKVGVCLSTSAVRALCTRSTMCWEIAQLVIRYPESTEGLFTNASWLTRRELEWRSICFDKPGIRILH